MVDDERQAPRLGGRRTGWQAYLFNEALGPPRTTRAEAEADLLAAGHASRDEQTGRVYVTVPASVEFIFL
jgi:hypothetical protein